MVRISTAARQHLILHPDSPHTPPYSSLPLKIGILSSRWMAKLFQMRQQYIVLFICRHPRQVTTTIKTFGHPHTQSSFEESLDSLQQSLDRPTSISRLMEKWRMGFR